MKKIILAAIAALVVGQTAFATISINYVTTSGADSAAVPGAGLDLPIGSLFQIIWTLDGSIDAFNPANPTGVSDNDIILGSYFSTFTGFLFGTETYQDETYGLLSDGLVPGQVYVRVFSSAAPTIGDYYAVSSTFGGLVDQDPTPGTANVVDIAPSAAFLVGTEIVPEPSVLAFLGIGAALVAVRRMRRS